MFKSALKTLCGSLLLAAVTSDFSGGLRAQSFTIAYEGDKLPVDSPYGGLFTTIGPGAPTSYFVGTSWSSDGNALTMTTVNPNDYAGATSLGIWFGRTDGYGDPSGFNLAPTSGGNRVDLRSALAPNSGEWSLYWYDSSGYGVGFYFLANGFYYALGGGSHFVPVTDMTAFHTYSSQIYNGQAHVFLDGTPLDSGPAVAGISNFLLLGDGSATDVSGYGSLLVDSLRITVNSGPVPVPEPNAITIIALALIGGGVARTCRHIAWRKPQVGN